MNNKYLWIIKDIIKSKYNCKHEFLIWLENNNTQTRVCLGRKTRTRTRVRTPICVIHISLYTYMFHMFCCLLFMIVYSLVERKIRVCDYRAMHACRPRPDFSSSSSSFFCFFCFILLSLLILCLIYFLHSLILSFFLLCIK